MKLFHNKDQPPFLKNVAKVFDQGINSFGKTPRAVLWKNSEGQQLRFEVLAGILNDVPNSAPLSINDFGCGYGALFDFLAGLEGMSHMTYTGYDISREMVDASWARTSDRRAAFAKASIIERAADFTFVSGTYNLKLKVDDKPWKSYVKSSLTALWPMSKKGLAFNMLDINHPQRGEGLYYADAIEFMDFCSKFSSNVVKVDDYPLHEWTILIRRD